MDYLILCIRPKLRKKGEYRPNDCVGFWMKGSVRSNHAVRSDLKAAFNDRAKAVRFIKAYPLSIDGDFYEIQRDTPKKVTIIFFSETPDKDGNHWDTYRYGTGDPEGTGGDDAYSVPATSKIIGPLSFGLASEQRLQKALIGEGKTIKTVSEAADLIQNIDGAESILSNMRAQALKYIDDNC